MADSILQQIINALDVRLKTILTANGYQTNLGRNVYEHRVADLQETELPALIYRDISSVSEVLTIQGPTSRHEHTLEVTLDIRVSGATAPDNVRRALADTYKVLGTDPTFGALVVRTEWRGHEMQVEQESNTIAGITITIGLVYRTVVFDPYTT
jgi:hypothetical protein